MRRKIELQPFLSDLMPPMTCHWCHKPSETAVWCSHACYMDDPDGFVADDAERNP